VEPPGVGERPAPQIPLEALLAAAPDAFMVAGADGCIAWANDTAHDLLAYDRGTLTGVPIDDLVPERFRARHAAHRAEYHAHPRARPMGAGLQLYARRRDGSEIPVEISLSPLVVDGGVMVIAVMRDVTARRALEGERNALAIELEKERERDRIAMDLHDGLMQDIYAVSLTLELALEEADDSRYASAPTVDRGIEQLHAIVRGIRSLIFDLRPRHFSGDLAGDLATLVQEFQRNSQIETEAAIDVAPAMEPSTAVAIHHIAHEALSNVQKHARARRVRLALSFALGQGTLTVEDDGRGFDTSKPAPEGHHGLRNMAARANAIGGALDVESRPGRTALTVTFPLRRT
jgi:PAS domain S-box-containing protein